MKKIFAFFIMLAISFSMQSQSIIPRFGTTPANDNTGRILTYKYVNATFANSYSVNANAYETIVKIGTLTHAQTLTATLTNCHLGDKLEIVFTSDTLTAGRVVTFSTGFVFSAATLTVDASQKATICFIFDGIAWIETCRAKQ